MTRLDYSRADVIARAKELWDAGLFATWGEAMAGAYFEEREAQRAAQPISPIAINRRVSA